MKIRLWHINEHASWSQDDVTVFTLRMINDFQCAPITSHWIIRQDTRLFWNTQSIVFIDRKLVVIRFRSVIHTIDDNNDSRCIRGSIGIGYGISEAVRSIEIDIGSIIETSIWIHIQRSIGWRIGRHDL